MGGDNIKNIITRFAKGTEQIQKVLQAEGADFMHSEHLGWILTCPSNLGTAFALALWSKFQNFRLVRTSRLFARRWDSNAVEPLGSIRPQLAALGTSLMLIVSENPKFSLSTSSSKVLLKSSSGNKPSKKEKTSKPRLPRHLCPKNIKFFKTFLAESSKSVIFQTLSLFKFNKFLGIRLIPMFLL